MKKLVFALLLLVLAGVLFAFQWRSDAPMARETATAGEAEVKAATAVVDRLLKACRGRDRGGALDCWVSGVEFKAMAEELRKLPSSSRELTVLDARYPTDDRAELWLTGTVDRNGNGCTFVLAGTAGGEFRVKRISALEEMLTAKVSR